MDRNFKLQLYPTPGNSHEKRQWMLLDADSGGMYLLLKEQELKNLFDVCRETIPEDYGNDYKYKNYRSFHGKI